jgi:hypothetical protein
MTHSAIGSYSSNLWEILCPLCAAAKFSLSLNTLYLVTVKYNPRVCIKLKSNLIFSRGNHRTDIKHDVQILHKITFHTVLTPYTPVSEVQLWVHLHIFIFNKGMSMSVRYVKYQNYAFVIYENSVWASPSITVRSLLPSKEHDGFHLSDD